MGQINFNNQKSKYCNLQAIQSGGSMADYQIPNGEVWMVDTTNSSKPNDGTGKYDSYVVGDGTTIASELVVRNIEDKEYDSTKFSGLGRKYLRKNIVNGINTLAQSMINQPNTIYVIQYDFTLGEDITIPENCVLQFEGGSLSNGTLNGNNTIISSSIKGIFNTITFLGTWNIAKLYVDWFNYTSDSDKIQQSIIANNIIHAEIQLSSRDYIIDKTIVLRTSLDQNTYLYGTNNKTFIRCNLPIPIFRGNLSYNIFKNISFYGIKNEGCYAFLVEGGYDYTIENCYFYNFDIALHIGFVQANIINCLFSNNSYGIVLCKRTNISTCLNVNNCIFTDNSSCGIVDTYYPNEEESVSNHNVGTCYKVVINNTIFEVNNKGFELRYAAYKYITNCWFERNSSASQIVNYLLFENNNVFSSENPFLNFEIPADSFGWGFGSLVKVNDGIIQANKIRFNYFGDNYKAINNGKLVLQESRVGNKPIVIGGNPDAESFGAMTFMDFNAENNSGMLPNKCVYLYINEDGTIKYNNNETLITEVGKTYNTTGQYYIIFSKDIYNIVACVNPYNTSSLTTFIQKRSSNNVAGGMKNDYSNQVFLTFKNYDGNFVDTYFSVLLYYTDN